MSSQTKRKRTIYNRGEFNRNQWLCHMNTRWIATQVTDGVEKLLAGEMSRGRV